MAGLMFVVRMGASILAIFAAVIGLAVGFSLAKWPGNGWKANALRGGLIGGLLFMLLLLLEPISMPAALFLTKLALSPIGFAILAMGLMIWAWRERARLSVFFRGLGIIGRTATFFLGVALVSSIVAVWISEYREDATPIAKKEQPAIREYSDVGLWVAGDFEQFEPTEELDASGLNQPLPILRAKKSLHSMQTGEILMVIATDSGSLKDFGAFCRQTGTICLQKKQEKGKFYFLLEKP